MSASALYIIDPVCSKLWPSKTCYSFQMIYGEFWGENESKGVERSITEALVMEQVCYVL